MNTSAFNTDKNRLVSKTVIEILSISCFVLLLVMADGGDLGVPKGLHASSILTEISTGIFFYLYFATFGNKPHLDWPFITKFENDIMRARIILKTKSRSIQRLLRYCQFHVLCCFN